MAEEDGALLVGGVLGRAGPLSLRRPRGINKFQVGGGSVGVVSQEIRFVDYGEEGLAGCTLSGCQDDVGGGSQPQFTVLYAHWIINSYRLWVNIARTWSICYFNFNIIRIAGCG